MITLLIILGSIVAYLMIGYHFGRKDVPRRLEDLVKRYGFLYNPYYYDTVYPNSDNSEERTRALDKRAREAASWPFMWAFFWPTMLLPLWMGPKLIAGGRKLDPIAQELLIKEQGKHIEKLERELGIGES